MNRTYMYSINLCFCLILQQLRQVPLMIYTFIFYRLTSIWENSLQITTISSFIGTWLGAFPIPLDWERPWQVGFIYLKLLNQCLYNNKTNEVIMWNWHIHLVLLLIKWGCPFPLSLWSRRFLIRACLRAIGIHISLVLSLALFFLHV